jgi:hypothetical protein
MLETLDAVPWSTLSHAYGEASDVPGLIRDLASPKKAVRRAAYGQFGSNIYHQGTVYSATAYVVPFFLELLEAEQVKDKTWLLHFLNSIAHGASYLDVHCCDKEKRNSPEIQQQLAEELGWVQAARDAVSDGYETYLRLLAGKNPRRRAYAAWVLASCQSHAEQVIPVMQECLEREKKQLVQASIVLSLGQLMPFTAETRVFFEQLLRDQTTPLLKIAAAMAHVFCAKEATPEATVLELLDGYQQPRSVRGKFNKLPFAQVDLAASISNAFRSIGFSVAPLAVPVLMRALKQCGAWDGLVLVDNLLYLALEGKIITYEMTAADLTDMQREVLWAIVKSKEVWEFGNMWFTVGAFFAPRYGGTASARSREDLVRFLLGKDN